MLHISLDDKNRRPNILTILRHFKQLCATLAKALRLPRLCVCFREVHGLTLILGRELDKGFSGFDEGGLTLYVVTGSVVSMWKRERVRVVELSYPDFRICHEGWECEDGGRRITVDIGPLE